MIELGVKGSVWLLLTTGMSFATGSLNLTLKIGPLFILFDSVVAEIIGFCVKYTNVCSGMTWLSILKDFTLSTTCCTSTSGLGRQ